MKRWLTFENSNKVPHFTKLASESQKILFAFVFILFFGSNTYFIYHPKDASSKGMVNLCG